MEAINRYTSERTGHRDKVIRRIIVADRVILDRLAQIGHAHAPAASRVELVRRPAKRLAGAGLCNLRDCPDSVVVGSRSIESTTYARMDSQ